MLDNWAKIATLSVGAVLVVSIGALLLARGATRQVSRAACHACAQLPTTEHDVGLIPQGQQFAADFLIRNVGDRRLIVWQQSGGCCGADSTSADLTLSPGEVGHVRVEIDPRNQAGRLVHHAWYTTNDPEHPTLMLTVRGAVE